MATGVAAAAPTLNLASQKVDLAPIGSQADTNTKQVISAIGITNPIPNNTLQGHGQGIYTNILA